MNAAPSGVAPPRLALGAAAAAPATITFPPLRQELRLFPGPPTEDGAPTWTVHDPVRNRFFRVGWVEFELLARWPGENMEALLAEVAGQTPLTPDRATVELLARFLAENSLLQPTTAAAMGVLKGNTARAHPPLSLARLLQVYLFLRVPLWRPDAFLRALLPWVSFFFTPLFFKLLGGAAVVSLYLVARQWEQFQHTLAQFFTTEGLVYYLLALLLSKLLHELGHALTATHYGLRVSTMGVALLVFWPVFYTDTSAAWTLTRKGPRLAIAAAGIVAELALAVLATLLWSFLPDGPLRSACFFLASTSWLLTLTVNLTPFIRFDGYYLLGDFLGIANLESRAFAMGKWHMREVLLGVGDPPPEPLAARTRLILILFAWAMAIYRLLLFSGLALLVYHLFFKALGLLLFVAEIHYFIVRPIVRELRVWWGLGRRWNPRAVVSLVLLIVGLGGVIYPWHTRVVAPAVMKAAGQARIFSPFPARVAEVRVVSGQRVAVGEVLFRLESPDLDSERVVQQRRLHRYEEELRRSVSDLRYLDQGRVAQRRLAETMSRLGGIEAQLQRLTVVSPLAGVVRDLEREVHVGRWVGSDFLLAEVVEAGEARVEGYVDEDALAGVRVGDEARFLPENPDLPVVSCRVVAVDQAGVGVLPEPYLASVHGGGIVVRPGPRGELVSGEARYRVLLRGDGGGAGWVERGEVVIQGVARSLAARVWRQVGAVLIRESGF